MQWSKEANSGFSSADPEKLYLPVDSQKAYPDVNSQEKDSSSLLNKLRKLIAIKNDNLELSADRTFELLKTEASEDIVAWSRGENVLCLFNLGSTESECNIACEFGENYRVLASTEGCRVDITGKKLHSTLQPRSYIILNFSSASL